MKMTFTFNHVSDSGRFKQTTLKNVQSFDFVDEFVCVKFEDGKIQYILIPALLSFIVKEEPKTSLKLVKQLKTTTNSESN